MDPEELLGQGGAYMLDVLTWDGADEDRWRLLILEDAGDAADHDQRTGRTAPPGDSAAGSMPGRHRVHAARARGG